MTILELLGSLPQVNSRRNARDIIRELGIYGAEIVWKNEHSVLDAVLMSGPAADAPNVPVVLGYRLDP